MYTNSFLDFFYFFIFESEFFFDAVGIQII